MAVHGLRRDGGLSSVEGFEHPVHPCELQHGHDTRRNAADVQPARMAKVLEHVYDSSEAAAVHEAHLAHVEHDVALSLVDARNHGFPETGGNHRVQSLFLETDDEAPT